MTDPLLRLLDRLPPASLDSSRADYIRTGCHAALARQRGRATMQRRTVRWPPLVAVLGSLYLTGAVHELLAMYGLL
jgi:hypothetical protein